VKFHTFRYLWPPRPENKIAPSFLGQIEALGWLAQAKMNGTNVTIYVRNGNSLAMGRHGPEHKLEWQPSERWNEFARSLAPHFWHVFQGELLHSKVKGGPRDTVYLFDMLVNTGDYLVGMAYAQRYAKLENRLRRFNPEPCVKHDRMEFGPGLWLACNHAHSFRQWYDAPAPDYVEGLVFKDPKAKLMPCGRATANKHGQAKVRYPKANVSF
jgi:hypothetical protein